MDRLHVAALQTSGTLHARARHPQAIRRLVPADEPAMALLMVHLDPLARFNRFGFQIDDLELLSRACTSLATSPAVFGAFNDGTLVGAAEITRFMPNNSAMMALAVDADWRRQGIGCRLLATTLSWAAEQAISSVQLQCARNNWAVRQIAQKENARMNLTAGTFFAEFDARPDASFQHALKLN